MLFWNSSSLRQNRGSLQGNPGTLKGELSTKIDYSGIKKDELSTKIDYSGAKKGELSTKIDYSGTKKEYSATPETNSGTKNGNSGTFKAYPGRLEGQKLKSWFLGHLPYPPHRFHKLISYLFSKPSGSEALEVPHLSCSFGKENIEFSFAGPVQNFLGHFVGFQS